MTAVAVHACSLERLEALVFAKDPAHARIGDPESFYERVFAERALGTLDDPDAATDALRAILLGPAPSEPLTHAHAVVLRSVVETLFPRVDDDAFHSATLADARAFARRIAPAVGPAFAESLEGRRVPFLSFAPTVHSPAFSYWTREEMKRFLAGAEAAHDLLHGDIEASDRLRRLLDAWRSAVAQGPDALLAITV